MRAPVRPLLGLADTKTRPKAKSSGHADPSFDSKRYESEAFGVAWEKPIEVVVRFSADQTPYVQERPTQERRRYAPLRRRVFFRFVAATRLRIRLRSSGARFFQRARTTSARALERSGADTPAHRAFPPFRPPMRPRATACGFFRLLFTAQPYHTRAHTKKSLTYVSAGVR